MSTILACWLIMTIIGIDNPEHDVSLNECEHTVIHVFDRMSRRLLEQSPVPDLENDVIELLMAGYSLEEDDVNRYTDVNFRHRRLILYAAYEFEVEPDFSLLMYGCSWAFRAPFSTNRIEPIWVGYVKTTGREYILSTGFGASVAENFIQMQRENDGIPHLSPICTAALLVRLHYWDESSMAVVNGWNDIEPWVVHEIVKHRDLLLAERSDPPWPLFILSPSTDTLLGESLDTAQVRFTRDELLAPYVDSIPIVPCGIEEIGDTITIELTVYLYYSMGELSLWEVVLLQSGQLLSCSHKEYVAQLFNCGRGGFSDYYYKGKRQKLKKQDSDR